MDPDDLVHRNNIKIIGKGERTLLMAHGFGCDQNMWRFITPALTRNYRVVLFDYVGSGNSDLSAYNRQRYSHLEGYARDIIEICDALQLERVTLVGHSVSSIIGLIAAIDAPEFFERMVMICPSPCFLNHPPDYRGGFERDDLQELIDLMDKNYIGWANYLTPILLGANSSEALVGELSGRFCSTDPLIAKTFAQATFFSDYRHLLAQAKHPSLILQSQTDSLAPVEVGEYMNARMPESTLQVVPAEGHCLHMTHPDDVINSIEGYLDTLITRDTQDTQ